MASVKLLEWQPVTKNYWIAHGWLISYHIFYWADWTVPYEIRYSRRRNPNVRPKQITFDKARSFEEAMGLCNLHHEIECLQQYSLFKQWIKENND